MNLNAHPRVKAEPFCIILNPFSAKGLGGIKWVDSVSKRLDEMNLPYEIVETKGRNHATKLAEEAVGRCERIIAVGGDGTINEVINGILKVRKGRNHNNILGVIPLGYGNDFAKNLGIYNLDDAIDALYTYYKKGDNICSIDVGKIEWFENGILQERYFCNNSGVGFDAHVVNIALEKERQREEFSYAKLAFNEIPKYEAKEAKIEIITKNGIREIETRMISLNVALGKITGRTIKIAPRASNTDGYFDVCLMKDARNIWKYLLFPIMISGLHAHLPLLSRWVKYLDSTYGITGVNVLSPGIQFQAEGEYLGNSPVFYTIIPRAMKGIYKKN